MAARQVPLGEFGILVFWCRPFDKLHELRGRQIWRQYGRKHETCLVMDDCINRANHDAFESVTHYKALADIERGFRVLKSDIEIAPAHHRLPDRIRAHALICFLALMLYRVMRMRLKAGEHSASPRTALNLLSRIQKHTAHIGDHTFNTTSTTTPEQLDLFDALNLPRPA